MKVLVSGATGFIGRPLVKRLSCEGHAVVVLTRDRLRAEARNLERITPEFLHFRVLRTSPPEIAEGTLIDYRLRLHGVPVGWRSRIEEWQPGRLFVDRQVRGPYRLWHHTHSFESNRGGTLVRDRVRYALPLGGFGQMVAGGLVHRDLDAIFDFRHRRLQEIFAPGGTDV